MHLPSAAQVFLGSGEVLSIFLSMVFTKSENSAYLESDNHNLINRVERLDVARRSEDRNGYEPVPIDALYKIAITSAQFRDRINERELNKPEQSISTPTSDSMAMSF